MLRIKFNYQVTLFLYLDELAVNWDVLALFFSWEHFMVAALNHLFKYGLCLPKKAFDFEGGGSFRRFTKLFSKEGKVTLLLWNLDKSSDLK